ncbi:MAG: HAD family phosphatase [Pirellulales bacterium]|nr:HAD family phosphatase [Pirellulales bacterium]
MENTYAVIFDIDGVLVDSYDAHFRGWREMAAEEGLKFTEADFAATFGRTSREIIAMHWGDRFDEARMADMDLRKEMAYRRIAAANFPPMPGAVELLRALHDAGFRLALGSSGPPGNVQLVVDKLEISDLLGAVVSGKDVTRGKPDPQVFLLAAERLGIAPPRCAVVEDAPAGIAAAHAAGMAAIGMMSTGRTENDLRDADKLVSSLSEITPEVLKKLIDRRVSN